MDLEKIVAAPHLHVIASAAEKMEAEQNKRDDGIVAARVDGYPWDSIAAAAQLTRQGTEKAAKRRNGGVLPQPRQRATEAASA